MKKREKSAEEIIKNAFSCKFYINVLLDMYHNSGKKFADGNSKIYMSLSRVELERYIENAKKVFAQCNIELEITDLNSFWEYQRQLPRVLLHKDECLGNTSIRRSRDILVYDGKLKDFVPFQPNDIDNLDFSEKYAFYGHSAQQSLSMACNDIIHDENTKEKVKYLYRG